MFALMLKSSKHLVELYRFRNIVKYNLYMRSIKYISNYNNTHTINFVYILAVYIDK